MSTVQINFYHLTRTPLEKALPKLLEKVLDKGERAVVLTPFERLKALDDGLWTYRPDGFLPHGIEKGEGSAADHPIWLTTTLDNPNNSTYLLVTGGLALPSLEGFTHCLYIFDSNIPSELKEARESWKIAKTSGAPHYWKQTEKGAWEEQELG
jgi:DNA polymerase-3 subunit chi